jgi:hypothetical protein
MQNHNHAKTPKDSILLVEDERNKRYLFFSRFLVQRSTKANTSKQRKSGSPLAGRRFHSNPPSLKLAYKGLEAFLLVGKHAFDRNQIAIIPISLQCAGLINIAVLDFSHAQNP